MRSPGPWLVVVLQACAPRPEGDSVAARGWEEQARDADPRVSLSFGWQAVTTYFTGFAENSVCGGDVNGDGYGDVVAGTPDATPAHVSVYEGSGTAGLDDRPGGPKLVVDTELTEEQPATGFGWAVATGDIDADGFDDVVVGAPFFTTLADHDGRAYAYSGAATGLDPAASWVVDGDVVEDHFGWSVALADVNGDGFDDVAIGAIIYENGSEDEGGVFVYLGSASGPETVPSWSAESDTEGAEFGAAVAFGDVNGDGFHDLFVGAPQWGSSSLGDGQGRVYVYLGSPTGLEANAAWVLASSHEDMQFGAALAGPDPNGDGFDDLLVGAPGDGFADGGHAYLYLGSEDGLDPMPVWTAVEEDEVAVFSFASAVASAGDLNGDGFGDVAVGDRDYTGTPDSGAGKVHVFLGNATGLAAEEAVQFTGKSYYQQLGFSLASAGDHDGDGFADLIVGAPGSNLTKGSTFLFLGGEFVDPDRDGIREENDLCPFVPDPLQEDENGDGVGDRCVPLTIDVQDPSVANGLSVEVDDALPGETVIVFLAEGPPREGPCPPEPLHAGLCLDVGSVSRQGYPVVADATGHASLIGAPMPPAAESGDLVTVQAAADRGRGGVKSDAVTRFVVP